MLAQNFMTAEELRICKEEYEALIKTLAFLERGECTYVDYLDPDRGRHGALHFNMADWDCGSCRCILGWARYFAGEDQFGNNFFSFLTPSLWNLCYPSLENIGGIIEAIVPKFEVVKITVEQAAHALRNYLTTGQPNWAEVHGMDSATE